ncbi:MAG: TatD family hydrolase [Clostridia bacterium]|nr:TatD family hydrolase [Clostridia bacterium]
MFDSHVHYSHCRFDQTFRYLDYVSGTYEIRQGTREDLISGIREAGVTGVVEPAIQFETNARVLALAKAYPGFVHPSVGLHPEYVLSATPKSRGDLCRYADIEGVIAIGETGLDFHRTRAAQHRVRQRSWFRFLIRLAHKKRLPLILHIRAAYTQAIRMLKRRRTLLDNGGVVHCFNADAATADELLALGFCFGIGGALLKEEPDSATLTEAVRRIPLDRILLETDAPYVLPYLPDLISSKQSKKICNSSTVIRAVAERIAQIKGLDVQTVLEQTEENARALFRLQNSP